MSVVTCKNYNRNTEMAHANPTYFTGRSKPLLFNVRAGWRELSCTVGNMCKAKSIDPILFGHAWKHDVYVHVIVVHIYGVNNRPICISVGPETVRYRGTQAPWACPTLTHACNYIFYKYNYRNVPFINSTIYQLHVLTYTWWLYQRQEFRVILCRDVAKYYEINEIFW